MAHEEDTDKSAAELVDRAWDLAKSIRTCMFTTWDGERQRSRPLAANVERENHAVYFLVDVDGEKNAQIAEFPYVSLAFSDNGGNKYVTLAGKAVLSNDRAKIKDLFSPFVKAWWDDENDPSIRLITFSPEDAEVWDGPNTVMAAAIMLTSAVTGAKPSFGDHAKVDI